MLVEHEKYLTTLRIIATNEDLVITRHTRALFFRKMFVATKEKKFGEQGKDIHHATRYDWAW